MKTLPPLPASDQESISRNVYDGFYKSGSRSFWGENVIETIKLKAYTKCEHYFERLGKEIQCKNCHIGWISSDMRTEDGVLYVGKEKVNI